MADIWTYAFDDSVGDLIPIADHYNQLQTPSPADGATYPDYYGWDCITGDKGQVNHDLECIARFKEYPGVLDYKVTLAITFPAMNLSDRYVDLWIRMLDDENGYFARLASNFGSPTVSLYRVSGGSETLLDGPDSVTGMSQGVAVDMEVKAAGNTISVKVGGNDYCSKVEDAADLINGNLRVGIATSGGRAPLGPTVGNLRVAEATDLSGKTGDLILFVDDASYGAEEMRANGIVLGTLVRTYFGPTALHIRVNEMHSDPIWRPEQRVTLKALISGTYYTIFRGRIRNRERVGSAQDEHNAYMAAGPRSSAKYVTTEHPTTKASVLSWNLQTDDEEYDATYSDKELGEIIAWYFDTYADELRRHGAIDPDPTSTPYVQAELDALTMKPTRMDLSGDFESVMLSLLSKAPNIALLVDHDDWTWHFLDYTSPTPETYSYTGRVIPQNVVEDDTTDRYTAVLIRSSHREKVKGLASTKDNTLIPVWGRGLQQAWTPNKQWRTSLNFVVSELVSDGQSDDMPVFRIQGKPMTPEEWAGGYATFSSGDQAGNGFPVLANSYDTVTISKAGGFPTLPPGAGDAGKIEDSRANENATAQNGFSYVHKRYLVQNQLGQLLNLAKDPCATLWKESQDPGDDHEKRVPHALMYIEGSPGIIIVGMPIVIPREDKPGCDDKESEYDAADASLDFWYWEETVREYRWPAEGYRGTAFSDDATKWAGGGTPGPEDWGVEREKIIQDDQWVDDAQNGDVEKAAQAYLAAFCDKPYGGTLELDGLEYDLRNLQKVLQFSTTALIRGASTGLESAKCIPFEVTFVFTEAKKTTVSYGTVGEVARQWRDLRERLQSNTNQLMLMARLKRVEEFAQCVQQNQNTKAAGDDDNPICAHRVRLNPKPKPGGGDEPPGVDDKIDSIQDDIIFILTILEEQKEAEPAEPPPPPDSPPEGTPDAPHSDSPGGGANPGTVTGMVMRNGQITVPRQGGTAREEVMRVAVDPDNPRAPAWGADRYMQDIEHIEPGPLFGPFHHKHQRDIEDVIWDGAVVDMQLTEPPFSATRVEVKLRAPALGHGDFYDATGGLPLIQAVPQTVVFDSTRTNPDSIVSLGGGQFTVVRAGIYKVSTSVSVEETAGSAAQADHWIEVNGVPVPGTDSYHDIASTSSTARTEAILTLAAGDIVDVKAQEITNTTTVATVPNASNIQFEEMYRPGAGALVEMVEGGSEDYTVNATTGIVTLAVAPMTGSYVQVDYETQGSKVRRSETMLMEIGTDPSATKTIATEVGQDASATKTMLIEILA